MPSEETVDKAVGALKRAVDVDYFFGKLTSPSWIEPLRARRFFQQPPLPEREGEYIRFPFWPASQYLARMAEKDPELVLSVIRGIPSTENPRVHEDMVTAMLGMPARVAARLVSTTISWLDSPYLLLLPHKLGELVIHLARGGQVKAAVAVAQKLLAPLPMAPGDEQDDALLRWMRRPQTRFRVWEYEQIAQQIVPALVVADPLATISALSDLLQSAVDVMRADQTPPHDGSAIWRSAIEPSSQNSPIAEVQDVLINSLRDAAETYLAANASALDEVVAGLEARPWRIFHRIALHLLRLNIDAGSNLVRQRVLDRVLASNTDLYHEYWLLMQAAFPRLEPADQQQVLDTIEAGPTAVSEGESQQDVRFWRRRRLAVLRDVLSPKWHHLYDDLVAEIGPESGHPEFLIYSTGMWVGPTSPQTAADLLEMSNEAVIGVLRDWQGTEDFMAPSAEGLSRALSQAVAQQPQRFAEIAERLLDVSTIYVRGALQGWTEALRSSVPFSWASVLKLCSWVSEHRPFVEKLGQDSDGELSQQWTRIEVARLLNAGFENEDNGIPLSLRELVWGALEPLTRDPDPTPEREEEYGGSNMDPPTLAINTTRGEAMHAVVRYAIWVHRADLMAAGGGRLTVRPTLPVEVRHVLDTHLDIAVDPSKAIRSVYGQWLPALTSLDPSWVEERLADIFPDALDQTSLRDSAWGSYITFSAPYDSVFELARSEYRKAVERAGDPAPSTVHRHESVHTRLGYHLMMLLLRGTIDIDDELVIGFFERASAEVRHTALTYVGRILGESDELPAGVIDRAQRLWQIRRDEIQAHPRREKVELAAFGWWFGSEKLPEAWSMEQLIGALRLCDGKVDVEHQVFENLARIAHAYPAEAVEAVGLIAQGDKEGWILRGSFDQAGVIMTAALTSNDTVARASATALIHRLGARGYYEVRSLLPLGEVINDET